MARKRNVKLDLNDAPPGYVPVPARQTWGNHSCAGCALLQPDPNNLDWMGRPRVMCARRRLNLPAFHCREYQREDHRHVRFEAVVVPAPAKPKRRAPCKK